MSKEDRQKVIDTRLKNKAKGGRNVSEINTTANNKKLREIKDLVTELKRTIASIQSKSSGETDNADDDDSDAPDNAGDSFGGRSHKKQKKE